MSIFDVIDIHERHLISGAVKAPERVRDTNISPEDFGQIPARQIWRALQAIAADNGRCATEREIVLLAEPDPDKRPPLARYLEECVEYPTRPVDVPAYADNVRSASVHRAVLAISDRVAQCVRDGSYGPDLAGRMAAELAALAARGQRCPSKTFDAVLGEAYDATFPADGRAAAPAKIPTGLDELDRRLYGGWPLARVAVVGARPGMGKTAFLLRAAHAAATRGFAAHVITNEDPELSMARRSWSQMASVDFSRLGNPAEMTDEQSAAAKAVRDRFGEQQFAGVRITNATNKTIGDIIAAVNAYHRKDGTRIVFLDYLQQLANERNKNRYEVLSDAMRAIGQAAADSGVAWVVGSQVRRTEVEIPTAKDFRDAGTIEEVAKLVLVLHRPRADAAQSSTGAIDDEMLVRVVKANEVARSDTRLEWDGARLMVCNNPPPMDYQ